MSKERIAGFMMGMGVGVLVGHFLRPQADAGRSLPAGSETLKPAAAESANTAAAAAGQGRAARVAASGR